MSQYEALDAAIVAAIEQRKNPLYSRSATSEAIRIAHLTGRESFRIIDGRLQALRKQNRIMWLTKAEAAGGLGGWRVVAQQADTQGAG